MVDARNDPAGYEKDEQPRRYRIRAVVSPVSFGERYQIRGALDPPYELGEVVERETVVTQDPPNHRFYHSLAKEDQLYADLCTRIIQRACEYFYKKDWVPLLGAPDIRLTDAEVRESISRLDLGENAREAVRTSKPRYVLTDLPWQQQRALVEQLYALRAKWSFEKL